MSSDSHPAFAYRLIRKSEWDAIKATGQYEGSPMDARDGYLHMSAKEFVKESTRLYFKGAADVIVLKIDLVALAPHVRWDPVASRAGIEFPHLYDIKLPRSAIVGHWAIPLDSATGEFTFPPELD